MAQQLTSNAVVSLFSGDKAVSRPVVQVTTLKHAMTADPNAPKRIKGNLSDGNHFGPAVFTADASAMVLGEKLKLHNLVRLTNFTLSTIAGTKICIVMGCEVVSEDEAQIGEPVQWQNGKAAAPAPEFDATASPVAAKPATPATANLQSRTGPSGNFAGTPPPQADPRASAPLVGSRAVPISALNPYSNRWMVKARVTSKGELRTIDTKMGASQVFSFDMCDESGEIRATAWREQAAKFHPLIEPGKVYLIARGSLKLANKRYSTLNNTYEMNLNQDSQIDVCDDAAMLPKMHYNFVPIADIETKAVNAVCDVIGVVDSIQPVARLTSKAGRELVKRTMSVADDSGKSIELTLWGATAETFPEDAQQVVAFKGLRVTEWNTKSLGASQGTTFEVNPEHDATDRLKAWWTDGGASSIQSLSVDTRGGAGAGGARELLLNDLAEVLEQAEALSDSDQKGEYFSVRSFVCRINPREESPMWYASCPKCNKKVVGDEANGCNCEACGWSGHECSYRYMLALVACDASGSQWLTAFNEQATSLLGKTAHELKRIKDQNQAEFEEILNRAKFQPLTMRLRAKKETYQGNTRVKVHVVQPTPTNFVTEGKNMLAEIAKYNI